MRRVVKDTPEIHEMNWSALPPLAALRAFAAYAETRSVTEAGAALNVSHAAISQQMRALEKHLNLPLLDRTRRQLDFTPEGAKLAQSLTRAFRAIADTSESLAQSAQNRALHISCPPELAGCWLLPLISEFRTNHPEIQLLIDPIMPQALFDPRGSDFIISHGTGHLGEFEAHHLCDAPYVIVASRLMFDGDLPQSPAELRDLTWLSVPGATEASSWMASLGLSAKETPKQRVTAPHELRDSLRLGLGLAAVPLLTVRDDLATGRLVELFRQEQADSYFALARQDLLGSNGQTFLRWLVARTAKT